MINDMKNNKKTITLVALVVLLVLLIWLCVGYYRAIAIDIPNPIATIEFKDFGTVKLELYPDKAPETVANFILLANNGYYDGTKIDEVVQNDLIQVASSKDDDETAKLSNLYTRQDGTIDIDVYCKVTGEKKSDCKKMIESINNSILKEDEDNSDEEDSENIEEEDNVENEEGEKYTIADLEDKDYCIKGEFLANNFEQNNLNLSEGTIAMFRNDYTMYSPTLMDESYNSGKSQFFIVTSEEYTKLSGYYAGFGRIIEGLDVIKEIAGVELTKAEDADKDVEPSIPKEDVIITSVRVDTNGIDYGAPSIYDIFDLMTWYYTNYYGLSQ